MKVLQWIMIILIALFLTGCGGSNGPEDREADRKASATPTAAEQQTTPTDAPDVTPTDVPEVTPTDTPEVTPTDMPEVTPTDVPEVTPTDVPEVTPTDTPDVTPVPTAEVTAVPTPTMSASLPGISAQPGPKFVTGSAEWFCYTMDESDANVGYRTDFLYLIQPGCSALMDRIADVNVAHCEECCKNYSFACEAADSADVSRWYWIDRCLNVRSDTAVFSFARLVASYSGGAHENRIRYGFNFETETGNVLSLDDYVTDVDRLTDLFVEALRSEPKYEDVFLDENWEKTVRTMFRSGEIGWLATSGGIEVWIPEGRVASYAVGEICVKFSILNYPDIIAAKYVGDYSNSWSVPTINYDSYRTETYNKIITQLVRGIGSYSWKEVASMVKNAGISYEGMDDREAEEIESNAFLNMTDPTSGFRFNLYFTKYRENDVQRLTSITLADVGVQTLIHDGYGQLPVTCVYIDPWAYDRALTGNGEVAQVKLRNADELSMLYYVTTPYYYYKMYD